MIEMNKISEVNIRPEVNILSVLKHLNYKPWFAMAEFIDNSLQSYFQNKEKLEELHGTEYKLCVEIEINCEDAGQVVIRDNAGGISTENFPRAFRAAELPLDISGLSEFGMGMKSAACWFAFRWRVRTTAINEEIERTIKFDMSDIVSNHIEHLSVDNYSASKTSHYTELTLEALHHRPQTRTLGKIKEHLSSIYRIFIKKGMLNLVFNGESLCYKSPPILQSPYYKNPDGPVVKWYKDIHLDFGKGQVVKGFAALREIGSTTHAGFALFRRNRLIEGSADEPYRPQKLFGNTNSYRYQRLFGELHLEGFQVSHTKDGFRWEEHEEEFLDILNGELKKSPTNLIDQAEGYRVHPQKKSIEHLAITATNAVARSIETDVKAFLELEVDQPSSPMPLPKNITSSDMQASERVVLVDDGRTSWHITLRTSIDPARGKWLSLAKDEGNFHDHTRNIRHLILDISLAHPFVTQFIGSHNENVELFMRFAVALAISLVLTEDSHSVPPQALLNFFNNLLRDALTRPFKNL